MVARTVVSVGLLRRLLMMTMLHVPYCTVLYTFCITLGKSETYKEAIKGKLKIPPHSYPGLGFRVRVQYIQVLWEYPSLCRVCCSFQLRDSQGLRRGGTCR